MTNYAAYTPRTPWVCTKAVYASMGDALRALQAIKRRHSGDRVRRNAAGASPYRCPHCNRWHVGHRAELPR